MDLTPRLRKVLVQAEEKRAGWDIRMSEPSTFSWPCSPTWAGLPARR